MIDSFLSVFKNEVIYLKNINIKEKVRRVQNVSGVIKFYGEMFGKC